jgi:phosphoserine phosphatase RsbU/P
MFLSEPEFTRSEILRVFNHSQIYLFLGAAITTIGLLAASYSLLRRRFDPLLFWFALFAILYGVHLEMNYQLFGALHLHFPVFQRATIAIGYLVAIPAFFFFREFGLIGRTGRVISAIVWPVFLCAAIATLVVGPHETIQNINNIVVIVSLIVVVVALFRIKSASSDVVLVRRSLLFFIFLAIYDNITGIYGHYDNIEPFGFVVLLVTLGIVAGRRALANEQQLSEVQKELQIAREMQLSILPGSFPNSRSFCVAARYLPMTSVAGDFYDFLVASNDEAGLLIADVSGHGVPAALIASMVKLAATTQRVHADQPSNLLLGMNAVLCGNTQSQFVTAGYVYLNATSQELRYSAAGHPPMLLLRDGEVTEVVENGLMLAAFDFATYTTVTLPIKAGDRFVLYTDGVLEAANIDREEYGAERLSSLVRDTAHLSHIDAANSIIAAIQQWSVSQNDDLTVLLCDYMVLDSHS